MKLGFFNEYQLGVVKGDRIVDVMPVFDEVHAHSPQDFMAGIIAEWDEVREHLVHYTARKRGVALNTVKIRPPLPRPGKILCMAVNYLEDGQRPMPEIDAFIKSSECVIGDGETIYMDPACDAQIFFHEAELAVVIGREAHQVSEEHALDHVFGYTGFIDVTARGFQPRGANSYFQMKSWSTFGPMGPFIVTRDEVPDPNNLEIRIVNNGEARQSFNTSDMAHKVPAAIAFCSRITPLHPGDIISTGTNHQGLGPIQDGDRLVMEIAGIGEMRLSVEDPLHREWPRGIDTAFAERMRSLKR